MFKKKMLKSSLIMVIVLVLLLSISGCDGNEISKTSNTQNTALPEFVREGGEYWLWTSDSTFSHKYLVKEIRDDGWIVLQSGDKIYWARISHISAIGED